MDKLLEITIDQGFKMAFENKESLAIFWIKIVSVLRLLKFT